jgi:Tfp pilus assembly protein PilO
VNRRALLIGAGAAVVVLLGWWFLLWSPRSDDIAEARDRTEQAEGQAQQLETEIARLKAAQRDEPLRRAQLETMRTAIPEDPNLAQFILDTNDAANKAGIDFISIAPTPPAAATPQAAAAATTATTAPAPAAPPAEIRVALQLQGGYFQVLDFVNRLNDLPRLVVIDNVTVSADQTGRLSTSLQARMFTRALPAGFGGSTTTTSSTTTTTAPGATTTTVAGATTTTTAGAQP